MQIVIDKDIHGFDTLKSEGVGTSLTLTGKLVVSPKDPEKFEISLNDRESHKFSILGSCEQSTYPLAKKKHSLEYLREIQHLRPRTNLISTITRIRSLL